MNLSTISLLIIDRGELSHVAEFLARYFGKVFYNCITAGPYMTSPIAKIGEGLDGVEWVEKAWKKIKKVDMVLYPDVFDSDQMEFIKELEIPVCAGLGGTKMETNKRYFKQVVEDAIDTGKYPALRNVTAYVADGLDEVWEYVEDKPGPLYLKSCEPWRGDWETFCHHNRYATKLFLNRKRQQLGEERANSIEISIERDIKDKVCEIGIDGFRLNGSLPAYVPCGYEKKDAGIIEKMLKGLPPILQQVADALSPEYDRLKCQSPYSCECVIAKNGGIYPIDETIRAGSPCTGAIMEMLEEKYAEAIYSLAHGELPEWSEKDFEPYGAEIILNSQWYVDNELHVGLPKDVAPHMRLRNAHKKYGQYYCVPNGCGSTFGTLAAAGKTPKEAYEKVLDMAKELEVYQMDYDEKVFEACEEAIKEGGKHGIEW